MISKLKKILNVAAIRIEEVVKDFRGTLKSNNIDHLIMEKYFEETASFFLRFAKYH